MRAVGVMNYVVDKLSYAVDKLNDEREIKVKGENVMNYVGQKLKRFLLVMENFGGYLLGKGDQYVGQKWKELLLVRENFGGYLLGKFDQVFPPETRKDQIIHWIKVTEPYIAHFVALIILFYFCKYCFGCCCRGSKIVAVKMMKAPGQPLMMPRHVFEASPKLYFRGLRGI